MGVSLNLIKSLYRASGIKSIWQTTLHHLKGIKLAPQPESDVVTLSDTYLNLFHLLQKKLYSTNELNRIVPLLNENERYIGALPKNWIEKIDKKNIRDFTLEVEQIFSKFATKAYSSTMINKSEETLLEKATVELKTQLEKILGENCDVEYVGRGCFGKVFKITCCKEELALKIYHKDLHRSLLDIHGKTKEMANAIYINKQMKPNQRSKFYFGKIAVNDMPDGYIVTQFVNKKTSNTKKPLIKYKYERFHFGDNTKQGNFINGMITDYGAISYNFKNWKQQQIAKEFFPLIQNGDLEKLKKFLVKYGHSEEYKDFFSTFSLPMVKLLECPKGFLYMANIDFFTPKEIAVYKALGLDFSKIENFDYSRQPTDILKKLGLNIK